MDMVSHRSWARKYRNEPTRSPTRIAEPRLIEAVGALVKIHEVCRRAQIVRVPAQQIFENTRTFDRSSGGDHQAGQIHGQFFG